MDPRDRNRQFPAGNPLANALVVVVGVLAIGLSLVLGFVALIALGSIFVVLAAIIGIRVWWQQRRMRKQAARQQRGGGAPGDARYDVIEGEYREVSRRYRRD
ncbi:MAG: hypothetical protein U5K76_03710 [Woeseiaceae bacterium]|nr:hypothetical protein [Woeseiaceae bacterium]